MWFCVAGAQTKGTGSFGKRRNKTAHVVDLLRPSLLSPAEEFLLLLRWLIRYSSRFSARSPSLF
jgi:hypothetical protein